MYHHVNAFPGKPEKGCDFITVEVNAFVRQMAFLHRHGYTTLSTSDYLQIIRTGNTPPKPVMITFDDGWLDNWVYAYPVLKSLNLKAVFFVITSLLPDNGLRKRMDEGFTGALPTHSRCKAIVESGRCADVMMSWDELREMEHSGLIDVASHTHTHQRWDALPPEALYQDIVLSKTTIEKHLNKDCTALCWPWGLHREDYIKTAEKAGFNLLFTTIKGTNTAETNPLSLKRIPIGNAGVLNFRKKLLINSHYVLSSLYYRILK